MSSGLSCQRVLFLVGILLALVQPYLGLAESSKDEHGPTVSATVERDCAPWDGPAFALWIPARGFGGQENSWIYLRIWQSPEHAKKEFIFPEEGGQRAQRAVDYYSGLKSPDVIDWAKQPRQQLRGTVRFSRIGGDEPVVGEVDFTSDGNLHLTGRFKAQWVRSTSTVPCG